MVALNINKYQIRPSKHFIVTWMRKWDYDTIALQNAIENSYKIEKVGKYKSEAYFRAKGKSRKLIFIKDDQNKEIFIITGAQGT